FRQAICETSEIDQSCSRLVGRVFLSCTQWKTEAKSRSKPNFPTITTTTLFTRITWMKDGNRIDKGSSRIRILHTLKLSESNNVTQQNQHYQFNTSSDEAFDEVAHAVSWLIIRSTEIEDEGVYTCLVTNEAGRQTSNQARLTIHVDGKWSEWYDWTQCPTECASNVTSQKSVGHEKFRQKDELLWDNCPQMCLLHHAQRQRHCNAPKPRGGGRPCLGDAVERISCMELCKRNLISGDNAKTDRNTNKILSPKEIGLVLFLALAILLFLGSASIVIFLISRTRCKPTKTGSNPARYTPSTNLDSSIRYKKTTSSILATDVNGNCRSNHIRTRSRDSHRTETKILKSAEPYPYRNLQLLSNEHHVRQFLKYHALFLHPVETVPRMRDRSGKQNSIRNHLSSVKRPDLSSRFPATDFDYCLCTLPNAHFYDITQVKYTVHEQKAELASNVQQLKQLIGSKCVPYNLQSPIPKRYTPPNTSSCQSVLIRKLRKDDGTQSQLKEVNKCGENVSVLVKLNRLPSDRSTNPQSTKRMKFKTFVNVDQKPIEHQDY
ncbi:hypothetical protein P879_01537, partial [Paragonimus westermani]